MKSGLVGHALLAVLIVLVSTGFDKDINQVVAGWFQATGSVFAIVFAVYIADKQNHLRRKEELEARLELYLKVSGYSAYVCQAMREAIKLINTHESPDVVNIKRHQRLLGDCIRALRVVEFSSIYDAQTASNWLMLEHTLSDFYGHIEDSGPANAYSRIGNLQRSLQRAERLSEEITNTAREFGRNISK
ncbi:hypothetical protein ACUHOQ_000249 [Pseudomonas aeruginosa]|uniref:hypothetical protein n=1 Tax=Pseudomonas aeruginosa TaxID=287 RepID=UPI0015C52602|nr:hypothetical protein [Pseudomonas aeruginosa]EKY1812641.1 hypothetical protein [Pseudomonas aeruginosa]MBI6968832.1 hypothetical protein [Pseudomonas aeruginosa]NPW65900.1 hypothetical protein [Pseudomonas aeruginosa]